MVVTEHSEIGAIVAANPRAAAVFEKYGIDFCCRGNRPLDTVSRERGVDTAEILAALSNCPDASAATAPRFATWSIDLLTSYIEENHHRYIREAAPILREHTAKIAKVHGRNHPELLVIARTFAQLSDDLEQHMIKEERILFPLMRELAAAARHARTVPGPAGQLPSPDGPIAVMMQEHQQAGDDMAAIRKLSQDYAAPADGCATYRACFQELADFEHDLHDHVHLENNLLFPRALALEAEGA